MTEFPKAFPDNLNYAIDLQGDREYQQRLCLFQALKANNELLHQIIRRLDVMPPVRAV